MLFESWTGKGQFKQTQHIRHQQMFYYSRTIRKKVNSYKERKNNNYNTENYFKATAKWNK